MGGQICPPRPLCNSGSPGQLGLRLLLAMRLMYIYPASLIMNTANYIRVQKEMKQCPWMSFLSVLKPQFYNY